MKRLFTFSYTFLALIMLILTSGDDAIAQQVRDHRDAQPAVRNNTVVQPKSYDRLRDLLKNRSWKQASDYTWRLMRQAGDRDRDGILNYPENDSFPCNDLRVLMILWGRYFGATRGYDDILLPRFNNRTVSCNISPTRASGEVPDAPEIVSFRVSPPTVKGGEWVKFYWEVENAESVRLYDDVGEIEQRGEWDFQENGTSSTTINKTTTFRLLAADRAGRTARKTFTVQVAGSTQPKGICSIKGKLEGRWRQRIRERPQGPSSIWTVDVGIYIAGSDRPFKMASVSNRGIYRFNDLSAGKEYTVRPFWASSPRQGKVSCTPGKTRKGPNFKITGGPLID
ncbi:MAG: GUN4 domain-containing protein [Pseudomonadota bacterium]